MSDSKLQEIIFFLKTMTYNFDSLITNNFGTFINRANQLMLSVTQMKRYLNQNNKYKKLLYPPLQIITSMLSEIAKRLSPTYWNNIPAEQEKYVYLYYTRNARFIKELSEYFKYSINPTIINKNYKLLKIIVTKYKFAFFKQTTLYKHVLDFYP